MESTESTESIKNIHTQKNFDIPRYLGRWYEIAKLGTIPFEKDCVFATADYSLLSASTNKLIIKNTCLDANRDIIRVSVGEARIPDMNDKSKLKVKFLEMPSTILESNYYCYWTDYLNYSIVGSPGFEEVKYLWILSRRPTIPKEDIPFLLEKVKEFGYDPDLVMANSHVIY